MAKRVFFRTATYVPCERSANGNTDGAWNTRNQLIAAQLTAAFVPSLSVMWWGTLDTLLFINVRNCCCAAWNGNIMIPHGQHAKRSCGILTLQNPRNSWTYFLVSIVKQRMRIFPQARSGNPETSVCHAAAMPGWSTWYCSGSRNLRRHW